MDKYFTTENRHARHNSGSTVPARDKFQFSVYMMQHEVCKNYCDLCNRGRLRSFPQSQLQLETDQNRPTQCYWCRLHGPTTPLQPLGERPSKGHSDKKSDLETETLAQVADCAQTATLLNLSCCSPQNLHFQILLCNYCSQKVDIKRKAWSIYFTCPQNIRVWRQHISHNSQ